MCLVYHIIIMLLCSGLEELKVEGNQLVAMPASILRLRRLRQLKVTNNFMHPLFWKDGMAHQPQIVSLIIIAITLSMYPSVAHHHHIRI